MNRTKQLQQLAAGQSELLARVADGSRGKAFARSLLIRKRILIPALTGILLFLAQPIFTGSAPTGDHDRIVSFIAATNPAVGYFEQHRIASAVLREASTLEIPSEMMIDGQPVHPAFFLAAFIAVESSFHREAISRADARGYMQLMPDTVTWMQGEKLSRAELFDTDTNIRLGARYLNYLFREFRSARRASLAYNAGPGSVKRGVYVERYWQKIRTQYLDLAYPRQLAVR